MNTNLMVQCSQPWTKFKFDEIQNGRESINSERKSFCHHISVSNKLCFGAELYGFEDNKHTYEA